MNDEVLRRFERFVYPEPNTGCWLWSGGMDNVAGYGKFWDGAKVVWSHRFSYTAYIGSIPDKLTLDHLCRNRICVNPKHLEPVTRRINLLRGDTIPAKHANKSCCLRGHPFNEINTRIIENGWRVCRVCHREYEFKRRRNAHR